METAAAARAGANSLARLALSLLCLSRDADAINRLINHADVRPYVGAPDVGDLDYSLAVTLPENTFLVGAYGGFVLCGEDRAEREVHVFITPEGRGRWGFEAAREVIAHAVSEGTCALTARVSRDMPRVRQFARRAGMRPTGETAGEYDIFRLETASCLPH